MKTLSTLALFLVAGALAGCASKPAHFYTLAPVAAPQNQAIQPASHVVVSVEPVEVPDYLDRPQIVTREGGNELKVDEFNRWGGALGENIASVLAEDLARQLGSDHVFANVVPPLEKPEYLVALRVTRLDALPGSHVLLHAQWKVTSTASKRSVSKVSKVNEPVDGGGYGPIVAAMDRALEQVSRQITREIQAIPAAAAPPAPPEAGRVSP